MKICFLILIFFHLIYFFPFYFSENVIIQRDLVFLTLPAKFEAAYQWRNGVIPFWDEKLSNGQPLLANPTSSSLYPLMLPLILFPNLKTFTFLCLFHHLFFIIGIFLFSNYILINPYLSLFLSTFLGYNGIVVEFFSFCNPLWGIMYLPFSLFFFYKYLTENRKIYLILTSISFALSIFAGFDLSPFLFSFFLMALTIYVSYRKIPKFFLMLILAFLFSAPQTIPTLLYLPHTSREKSNLPYEDNFGFYSLHPLRAIEIFIPKIHGTIPSKDDNFYADAISDKENGLFMSPYFGLFSLLLFISIRPFEKKWIFFIISLLFLLISFGKYFPLHFYLLKIPIFSNIRFPEKFLIFLLISFYFFYVINFKKFFRISIFPSLFFIFIISTILLINEITSGILFKKYISYTTFQKITNQPIIMKKYLFFALILIIAYFLMFFAFKKFNFIYFLFPLVCFFDLFYGSHHRIIPYQKNTLYSPLAKVLREQKALRIIHIEENVVYNSRTKDIVLFRIENLYPNSGIFFGFFYSFSKSVDSMEPYFANKNIKEINFKIWGISHIILSGPKAPKNEEVVRFKGYSLWQIDKSPTFVWFLNEKTKEAEPLPPILKLKNPSNFKIKLNNRENGILWIGYTLLPGWNVYVNGKKGNFSNPKTEGLNVFLKAGENIVEFKYSAPGFYFGLILFLFGILLCAIIILWKKRNSGHISG